MNLYVEILQEAIKKQNELLKLDGWEKELLRLAPPVLWFGNNDNSKSKIVTIGANPSRSEFLNENNKTTKQKSHHDVEYLNNVDKRFYIFENSELAHQLEIDTIEKIIDSYNCYFTENPYRGWFGIPNGGKVEGLVNGFDASFYPSEKKQAIHLDLFPFATLRNFKDIHKLVEETLFKTGWAQQFLRKLIQNINPEMIIVFGVTNYLIFKSLFEKEIKFQHENTFVTNDKNKKTRYYINDLNGIPLIGLNANFGNTTFSKQELLFLGREIQKLMISKNLPTLQEL